MCDGKTRHKKRHRAVKFIAIMVTLGNHSNDLNMPPKYAYYCDGQKDAQLSLKLMQYATCCECSFIKIHNYFYLNGHRRPNNVNVRSANKMDDRLLLW